MRKIILLTVLTLIFFTSGCDNPKTENLSMTKEEATQLVIEKYQSNVGQIEVVTITPETINSVIVSEEDADLFIITWENKENCHEGKTIVHKNGEMETVEESQCY